MKNGKHFILAVAAFCVVLSTCGGSPSPVSAQTVTPPDELDAAVRETSNYLNKQLPKGNKLMILNVQSDYPALSEYIIDELIANTVNDRIFSVVDRQQLNTIRAELDFQMSGEVDDATAQSLGRMVGAQIIISGAVSRIGDLYRLRVRALNVQSAQIEGQFNRNIPNSPTVTALVNSKATGYGSGTASGTSGGGSRTSVPAPIPAQTTPAQTPAPVQAPATPATPSAPVAYKIGDRGPAGGIVFYDKGNNSDDWRYLEAAPRDLGKTQWQSSVTDISGTKDSIGSGRENTQIASRANCRAAMMCQQFSLGGYQDWFLPSKNELDLMYINLKMIRDVGNFSDEWYWSSTQYNEDAAWAQLFKDGNQRGYSYDGGRKSNTYSVRACRRF
ncbi:MAG: DUF1566 domain-containing protein [Spirochaetaceae bacterium]|jgi:hypothetical protein|nr:DUF1566 domain-containing protein [Spirochaetaceae bacterium]